MDEKIMNNLHIIKPNLPLCRFVKKSFNTVSLTVANHKSNYTLKVLQPTNDGRFYKILGSIQFTVQCLILP